MESEDTTPIGFKKTSFNIALDDWNFCKEHNFKFNVLMQERIAQLRAIENGVIVENVNIEREKKEKFIKMCEEMREFMREKGVIDEYIKRYVNG
jgi:hypothetical protein